MFHEIAPITKAELEAVNPAMEYAPSDFDYSLVRKRALALTKSLSNSLGLSLKCGGGIEDATFHSEIRLTQSSSLRLSNFCDLAVILGEETLTSEDIALIDECLIKSGYRLVRFTMFGSTAKEKERFNGVLFNQLFDYT